MKKGTKIALIVLAVVVIVPATALAVWWPVSPEKLCKHEVSLLEGEFKKMYGGEEIPADLKAELDEGKCVEDAADIKLFHGIGGYKNYSSCMMKATTVEEADKCTTS
jgi:hypothetical protein